MVDTVFTGVRARWQPLYAALMARVQAQTGPVEVKVSGARIMLKHGTTFAEVAVRGSGLTVALVTDEAHADWCADSVRQASKRRVTHTFAMADEARLADIAGYLALAYAQARPARAEVAGQMPEVDTVDAYIAAAPADVRPILLQVRATIRAAAPQATERISWQMPTYTQGENLVHFAAQKQHLGFYPSPEGLDAFAPRLAGYKRTKGGVQFPYSQPIPYDLIAEITRWRVKQVTQ